MSAPKLMKTSDYSKFELCQFNRDVRKVKYLRKSMQNHGWIPAYPLHVRRNSRGKLEIVGGHHRFTVAQELGIPVLYVVSDDDATVHELEKATVHWSAQDYLASFVRCGYEQYRALEEYHNRTGITLQACISLLGGEAALSQNKIHKFKDGSFEITDRDYAETVASIICYCRDLGIDATRQIFVQAISRCVRAKEFNVETFKARAASNPSMLTPQRSLQEQMAVIEHVYNFKAQQHNRVPLAFLVDQAMAARNLKVKKSA